MTRKADHSPHSRLGWDLLMPPATPEQFGMWASNWSSQNSALQNRVGRPPWSSPQGRGFTIPPPTPSLPRGSAPTELLTVRSVIPSLLSWLERAPGLLEAASQCRIPGKSRESVREASRSPVARDTLQLEADASASCHTQSSAEAEASLTHDLQGFSCTAEPRSLHAANS